MDIMSMYKIRKNQGDYVCWDGKTLFKFGGNPILTECCCMYDGLMPVEVMREIAHKGNIESIIIFSCKSGHSSFEKKINNEPRGVFTYCWTKVFKQYGGNITLRNMIKAINENIKILKVQQVCEVICLEPFLEQNIFAFDSGNTKCVALCLFDMCRTIAHPKILEAQKDNPYLKELNCLLELYK